MKDQTLDQGTENPEAAAVPKVWDEQSLRQLFQGLSDVQIQLYHFRGKDPDESGNGVLFIYSDGLCDSSLILKIIFPELNQIIQQQGIQAVTSEHFACSLPMRAFEQENKRDDIEMAIFQGELVLAFLGTNRMFSMNICRMPQRSPEESSTEISIKGPKDGFVEAITVNMALIRKRIRSTSLQSESFVLGTRTKTQVSLMYIDDIINKEILDEARSRLTKIVVDGLYSINQLEEALADAKYPLFPLLDSTGRPDFAVTSLLAGRFVIIVDGNPLVLIAPSTFALILKSPEDAYFNFQYISFARIIRLISFWLSITLPGFWVALTAFHPDQLPFRLMATISVSRLGLPLSSQLEMFVLLLLLEIFREAGVRLPSSIGQTLTVIGGLVIGDASIRAGLVSPSVVVVGAVTAVMGVTLVNQALSTVVSVIRFSFFFVAAIIGMYGLILAMIFLLFYMSRLRSFGVPYLAPLSPFNKKDIIPAFFRMPWSKMKQRPDKLRTNDSDHKKDKE